MFTFVATLVTLGALLTLSFELAHRALLVSVAHQIESDE